MEGDWKHRSEGMKCGTCMWYISFRCRRHAPTISQGYPAVFPTDWCGDHKLDKETMLIQEKGKNIKEASALGASALKAQ